MISPALPSDQGGAILDWIVISAILGIVVILLIPAAGISHRHDSRPRVKNDATNIATGITAFQTEYGWSPIDSEKDLVLADDASAGDLLDLMAGVDGKSPGNPRRIMFLEVPKARYGKNGRIDGKGPWLDAWGNAYFIAIDGDGDGFTPGPDGARIAKRVLVWSRGDPDRKEFHDPGRWIKSWE